MARIPRIERQVSIDATPQPYDDSKRAGAVGTAIASLGKALSSFAADAAAAREDLDAFEASVALTRFKNEQDLKVIEHNREVEGDGRDHLDRYTQQYDTERQRLLDSLPNNAKVRQRAALLTENWRGNYRENVYRRQLDHLSVYKEQELTGLVSQSIAPLVNGDIETVDNGIRQIEAALTNTRGLSPAQQERIRRLAVGLMAERWLEQAGPDIREQAEKRIQAFQMAPLKDAFGDIDASKYKGKSPSAQTPPLATSERGIEFIKRLEGERDVGWDYQQYSGPYGVRRGKDEKLTLAEADVRLRQEVAEVERAMAAKIKAPISQDQHDALVSFFYNLGTGKGRLDKIAAMINEGRIEDVPNYMRQFTRAGGQQLRGLVTRRNAEAELFARGGSSSPVRVADAGASAVDSSPDQPGAPRLLPSESLFAQWLLHNKNVIDKVAEKKQLEVYAAAKLDAWMSGREPFNAYVDEDRKLVDEYFAKYTRVGQRLFDGDPGAVAAAVAAAQRLNYVPRAVEEAIQGLVAARDEAKQVLGLDAAASILARNPNAFDKVEGGAEVKKNAGLFSVLTGERGKTPQEALAHMKEIDSFEWKKQAEAREKEAKRIVEKELSESDITGAFDDNFLPFTAPSMPGLPGVRDVLFGTYKDLVRENYIRYGDDKVAKALAIRSLRQMWGVSEVTGTKQIMRYPPEHWYRQIGGDGHKWLKDQLAEDVERETGKKRDTVELRADSLTQRQIARGESPTYEVLFKADDGTWQRLPGRWIPDIDKAVKAFAETFEKERALKAKPLPEQLQERPIFRPLPEDTPRYAPERLLREGFTSFWESLKKKPPKESPPLSGMP